MAFERGRSIILIALVLALCLLVGCGGSTSSSGSSSSSSASTRPAAGFSKKAKAAAFGEEAAEEERTPASQTLERYMSARAVGNYRIQCETLSAPAVEAIEENGGSCTEALKAEARKAPPGSLANNLEPIAALRIQGSRGVALYHGGKGQDYAMPMELENGEWKVAATLTETLPTN